MVYLLFNYGKIFNYLEVCINNILSVDKNAKVYLITDKKILSSKDINVINFSDLEKSQNMKSRLFDYFEYSELNSNKYPVFLTSLLRIFAINEFVNQSNIKKFIHFDNDVLIYKPFEYIQNKKIFNEFNINITRNKSEELVFGYSYFPNINKLKSLINHLSEILDNHEHYSNSFNRGKTLYEMRMLNIASLLDKDLFFDLPSLPYYSKNKIIFDPSSYGQYFNGKHINRGNFIFKRRWVSTQEIIGREIMSKRIKPFLRNKLPYVKYENTDYQLMNLHVHSKNLNKFVNGSFKKFISLDY